MTPAARLGLAFTAFVLAATYCFYHYRQMNEARTSLAAASTVPMPKKKPTVSAFPSAAGTGAERRAGALEITPRVREMIANTPKSYGGQPQPLSLIHI